VFQKFVYAHPDPAPAMGWHPSSVLSSDHVGAVFFDVDGTLVPGTSSSTFLAGLLGHRDEVTKAEDAYATGVLDNRQVSELEAVGWTGVSEKQVFGWLDGLPLVPGIAETVAWCRGNALVPVLATLAWSPVGSYLAARFGFHSFCGPRLEIADGRFTGSVARHFDEYGKRDFALTQARNLGLDSRACGAVGDSRSDLPLFASIGLSVAFNASEAARAAATATVDDDDLRGVLPVLSRLVTATR
jgi:phosphoserine phosphatase